VPTTSQWIHKKPKKLFQRIGSENKKLELVAYSKSDGQHVLAGEIRDPQAVTPMVDSIVKWMTSVP